MPGVSKTPRRTCVKRKGLQTGARIELVNFLDGCGHLCAATGRPADVITMWAAFAALLAQDGAADIPGDVRRRAQPLRAARRALGPDPCRGRTRVAMSLATAAEYALMLTAPPSQQARPPGLANLNARERQLVALVARGRTDAQIAAELYISVRTHLDRIRDKTGARSRADLTRLALQAGLA